MKLWLTGSVWHSSNQSVFCATLVLEDTNICLQKGRVLEPEMCTFQWESEEVDVVGDIFEMYLAVGLLSSLSIW